MNENLWKSFIDYMKNPEATKSSINYYTAITSWVKSNKRYFPQEMLTRSRLDVLLDLDPQIFIVEDPPNSPLMEIKRLEENKPKKTSVFLILLGDRLWNMVTIRGKDCPRCDGDELRYVIAEELSTGEKEMILECNSCVWTEKMNGSVWSEGLTRVVPVSKECLSNLNQNSKY